MFFPGSQKYNDLLTKAKQDFESNTHQIQDPLEELKELLNSNCDIIQEIEKEDNDSWLDVELDTFDEMLKSHFGVQASEPTKSHQEIPNEIKTFLRTMSDLKGVEENQKKKSDLDFVDFRPEDLEKAFNKVLDIQDNSEDEDYSDEDIDFDQDFEGEMKSYFGQMSEELKGSTPPLPQGRWKPLNIGCAHKYLNPNLSPQNLDFAR